MKSLAVALIFGAACTNGPAYVQVRIERGDAPSATVSKVVLNLSLEGDPDQVTIRREDGLVRLPTDVTLDVKSGSGRLFIEAIAYDADDKQVAHGSALGEVGRKQSNLVRVVFGVEVTLPNFGDMGEGGAGGSGGGGGSGGDGGVGAGNLFVSQGSLNFGTVVRGSSSSVMTLIYSNTGDAPLDPFMMQPLGADFVFDPVTDDCRQATLGPQQSCNLALHLATTTAGPKSGMLVVSSGSLSVTTTLAGLVVEPGALTISPDGFPFGDLRLGQTSAPQTFTIQNTGGSDSSAITVGLSGGAVGQFQLDASGCNNMTLGPGATCNVTVAFSPSSAGPQAGQLVVDATVGGTDSVSLSGNARPVLTVQYTGVVGGSVTASGTALNCNVGGGICFLEVNAGTQVQLRANNGTAKFSSWQGAPNCTTSTQCNVTVNSNLTVTAVFQAAPPVIDGTGTAFSLQRVNFSSSAKTISFKNNGGQGTTLGNVTINNAEFSIVAGTDNCSGKPLAVGQSCSLQVKFMPSQGGSRNATATVGGSGVYGNAFLSGDAGYSVSAVYNSSYQVYTLFQTTNLNCGCDDQGCGNNCDVILFGSNITVYKQLKSGKNFISWNSSCQSSGTSATCSLDATQDSVVTLNFN